MTAIAPCEPILLCRPGELVQPELQYKLLTFCSDVAMGLEYLARKDFIHRDIAARNILLAEDCTCKVILHGVHRVYNSVIILSLLDYDRYAVTVFVALHVDSRLWHVTGFR